MRWYKWTNSWLNWTRRKTFIRLTVFYWWSVCSSCNQWGCWSGFLLGLDRIWYIFQWHASLCEGCAIRSTNWNILFVIRSSLSVYLCSISLVNHVSSSRKVHSTLETYWRIEFLMLLKLKMIEVHSNHTSNVLYMYPNTINHQHFFIEFF